MIELPPRPDHLRQQPVAAWSETVVIPTYPLPPPDRNPLFLENRVYQGSSGRVYPNPVTDRVSDERVPVEWEAIHLENEYLRLMILPAIGGRIHVAMDRSTGYDLFYRQNVIKPALVGLLGPWISGGVEFNWPQHHRPSTYMPVDWEIEHLDDGGVVAWCSEHEPTERMKGMHGVTLRPGSSLLELQVRLTNRTPLVQTFLWWANVGVHVHDQYQAFFPPDVTHVADHARRAVSTFPIAEGTYYGIDYGARPPSEADLRWYRNIPVPTSYMAMGTEADFFGGYDHAAEEGYVHWADHTIAPGKKLWTWGDHQFGHAWDRELTDDDGPYVELMAGVFTDNQPDFSFLMPGEVRTFRQYWYPIAAIGPAHQANPDAAVSLRVEGPVARVGVAVTERRPNARVRLQASGTIIMERTVDLAPDAPLVAEARLPRGTRSTSLHLVVEHEGRELVRYEPTATPTSDPPPPATEPPPPSAVEGIEELYLTGLHLGQYRHATRHAADYFREGLRRDPGDSRCNTAMGEWHLRRGELDAAADCLRAAIQRLSIRNPNPRDGEATYLLGWVLWRQGDLGAADAAFGKSGWDGAFQPAADRARAEIAASLGEPARALRLLDRSLATNAADPTAMGLKVALLRRAGEHERALALVEQMTERDQLDARAAHERLLLVAAPISDAGVAPETGRPTVLARAQIALDVAHDEARAGLLDEAIDVLERSLAHDPEPGSEPLLRYTLGWLEERRGDAATALAQRRLARALPPHLVFPARLEEIEVLRSAIAADGTDPRAPYYLGNLLYDRRRYEDAIAAWRRAARLDSTFPTVHRNLAIAEFNVLGRPERALAAYRRSLRADPTDARVLYELDQLRKRMGHQPETRLAELEANLELVHHRDDLSAEYVTLLNRVGRHDDAVVYLSQRRFHPWEGGEGRVSGQWVIANRELARRASRAGLPGQALGYLRAAMDLPVGLGEGKHLLTPENELHLMAGQAARAAGDSEAAVGWFVRAAQPQGDLRGPSGDGFYWQSLALRELGDAAASRSRAERLLDVAREGSSEEARIPYFATSLPTLLLFDDDLGLRARREARYLEGLALLSLGRRKASRTRFSTMLEEEPDRLEAALRLAEMDAGEA